MCVEGAGVCSPGCWPGSEPSWHAPRLPYPAADGSEPLSVQSLSYNSPVGADRSAATISKMSFVQDHQGEQLRRNCPIHQRHGWRSMLPPCRRGLNKYASAWLMTLQLLALEVIGLGIGAMAPRLGGNIDKRHIQCQCSPDQFPRSPCSTLSKVSSIQCIPPPQYLPKFRGSQFMALGRELHQTLDGFLVNLRASRKGRAVQKVSLRIDTRPQAQHLS